MKKKRKDLKQLNNATVIKLIVATIIIVVVEIATGFFVYNQFSSQSYNADLEGYKIEVDGLSSAISKDSSLSFENLQENDEAVSALDSALKRSGTFDYYVVFREAQGGEVISGDGILEKGKSIKGDYGLEMGEAGKLELGDRTYVFVPAKLGDSVYHFAALKDYSAVIDVNRKFVGNTVGILVAGSLLICAVFIAYAYAIGSREKLKGFKYRIVLEDKHGRILRCNNAFRHEFSSVTQIPAAENLKTSGISLVNLNANSGDKMIAMRVTNIAGQTKIYADDVANADLFVQTTAEEEIGGDGKSTGSFAKVFEGFVAKGKRTLLGVLYVSSLDQIKTLFGKQMSTDIQRLILKKARDKFTYAYEIDFGYIGIAYPDGKKLDNLLADLEDIHRYISMPLKIDDNLFTVELKSGFAICDSTMKDQSFEYVYKSAEAARQRAIDTKIADYLVYTESQRKLYDKYFITFDIKQMLAEGAFEMEYQPQYNIKEGRVEGFEALFRVKKSWNVNVDTFSFITYAERTGAMVQLGDFIFDTGMQFAKKLEGRNISVSLNVSPVQLMQAGFTENFLRLYKKYGLKPGSICVEITESFLMTNFNETLKKLDVLTASGIDVHLDDFGTEYSSLLYIKKLPISTIKIDKEFVKDVLTSKESQAVIKFITNIAKLLNRTTICEGVETPQEYDMLNYLGCDTIQGWVIGKSMKPEAALEFIDTFDYKKVVAAFRAKQQQKG